MAASSWDNIPEQLAALLGREAKQIRKTEEKPPRVSVIDVISMITGKVARHAAEQLQRLICHYPEVAANCGLLKFPGRRQRDTQVADVRGIVDVIMLLPGHIAAKVRRQAADLLCRWLGGDLRIIDEVCAIRGFHEQLAVRAPEDPRRLFGEAVEAAPSAGSPLAQVLSNVNERLTKQEQMLARIHDSLEHDRARVNLNVRAPKRAAPHQPQITRDLAGTGRPFPVARFLDFKEREDPSWKCARRSFAPTFSMQVQVLKKKKLREEGKAAIYIEQNHRPQLLYTEEDRELMEEAWILTAAHREDLAGRPGNPQEEALVVQNRTNVMDMLRGRERKQHRISPMADTGHWVHWVHWVLPPFFASSIGFSFVRVGSIGFCCVVSHLWLGSHSLG